MNPIKTERLKQSMSQKRLAILAGIDARTLRKIEKGEPVSPESYRSACLALHIEPSTAIDMPSAPASDPGTQVKHDELSYKIIGLLGFALLTAMPFAFNPLFGDYYFDQYPNLQISALLPGPCEDTTGASTAERVERALGGSKLTSSSMISGTDQCTVLINTFVPGSTERDIIKSLIPLGIDATILKYRPSA